MQTIHVVMMLQYFFFRESTGGGERQVASMIPFLQDQNVKISVIARHRTGIDAPDYEEINGVSIYRGPNLHNHAISSAFYYLFALNKLRQIQPDVIHTHGLFSPTQTALTYKRFIKNVPVVSLVLRGGVLGDVIRLRAKPFGQQRIREIGNHMDGLISISKEITDELLAENIPDNKIWRIPYGVDVDRFKPLPPAEKQALRQELDVTGDPVVVFVARLVAEKRADNLIQSWAAVREHYPDARLLLVGQGNERQRLEAMAGDGVRFVGAVENVEQWLQVADAFVLPSIAEGLSNSMLEALGSGLPIVITAVGDAPRLIKPDTNGWCIPPDDIDALTQAFLEAFADRDQLAAMGNNNRQLILDDFQMSVIAQKWRELYDSVL